MTGLDNEDTDAMGFILRHRYACTAVAGLILVVLWWRATTALNRWPLVNAGPRADTPLICFGDSLVSGAGAGSAATAYPAQLGLLLHRNVAVYGRPGDTAAAARDRLAELPESLGGHLVVVTLGGNDLINRVPWNQTVQDLRTIVRELQRRGARVAYTGVESPLLGGGMTARHRQFCRELGVILVPHVLKGILTDPGLRADQIHPNDAGYRQMATHVAEVLRRFL